MKRWQVHNGGSDKLVLPPIGQRTTITLADLIKLAKDNGVDSTNLLLSVEGRDAGAYDGDVPVLIVLRGAQ